jgi:hypothetical protein
LTAYDLVVKSTGTTWEIPVKGDVEQRAFTGVPSSEALWSYLDERKSMREDGSIKPGTKVLIGGTSLSAFDPVGILLARTGMVKVDPSISVGFSIDEERAREYPGLITFFNRAEGEVVASRHATSEIMPEEAAFFTPEMVLSQQLQKGQDPFQVYLEKARLLTAVYLKKPPKDIEPKNKTPGHFARMAKKNQKLADDPETVTEASLLGAACRSRFFFNMLRSSPGKKRAEIERDYSLMIRGD